MPEGVVGEAWIEAHVDGSGLPGELRRIANAAAQGAKIEFEAEIDDKSLIADVKKAALAASQAAEVEIQARLDSTRLKAEAAALRRGAGGVVSFQAVLDAKRLSGQAGAATRRANEAGKIRVSAEADFTKFNAQLRELQRAAAREIKIKVAPETIRATQRVVARTDLAGVNRARLEAEAAFKANPINAEVKLDVDRSAIDAVGNQIRTALSPGGGGGGGFLGNYFREMGSGGSALGNLRNAIATTARFGAAQAVLIAGAFIAATPYVTALVTSVAQLALELASAAVAAGAFAAVSFASVAIAMQTATIATTGMSEAFSAMAPLVQANARGLKATDEQLKAYAESLRGLAPSAKDFVQTVFSMSGAWGDLTKAVQEEAFRGLGSQLERTGKVILPILQQGLVGMADSLNDAAIDFGRFAASAEGSRKIGAAIKIAENAIDSLAAASEDVGVGLLNLFVGMGPSADEFGETIEGLAEDFRLWTEDITKGGKDSKLNKFLGDAKDNFILIKDAVLGAAGAIEGFWIAMNQPDAKSGKSPLDRITEGLEWLGNWFRDPANAGKIEKWVGDASTRLGEMATAATELAAAIMKISDAITFLIDSDPGAALTELFKDVDWTIPPPTILPPTGGPSPTGWFGDPISIISGMDWPAIGQFFADRFKESILGRLIFNWETFFTLEGNPFRNTPIGQLGQWIMDEIGKFDWGYFFSLSGSPFLGTLVWLAEQIKNGIGKFDWGYFFSLSGSPFLGTLIWLAQQIKDGIGKFDWGYFFSLEGAIPEGGFLDTVIKAWKAAEKWIQEHPLPNPPMAGGFSFGPMPAMPTPSAPKVPSITPGPINPPSAPNLPRLKWPIDLVPGPIPIPILPRLEWPIIMVPGIPPIPYLPPIIQEVWRRLMNPVLPLLLPVIQEVFRRIANDLPHPSADFQDIFRRIANGLPKPDPDVQDIFRRIANGLPKPPPDIQDIFRRIANRLPKPPQDIQDILRRIITKLPKPPRDIQDILRRLVGRLPDPPDVTQNVTRVLVGGLPSPGSVVQYVRRVLTGGNPAVAKGALFTSGPQQALIGEAGPEAVVPLTRTQPLDPQVRALLADVAYGRGIGTKPKDEGGSGRGPVVGEMNVMLPTGDPQAAAMAVVNRLATVSAI